MFKKKKKYLIQNICFQKRERLLHKKAYTYIHTHTYIYILYIYFLKMFPSLTPFFFFFFSFTNKINSINNTNADIPSQKKKKISLFKKGSQLLLIRAPSVSPLQIS
jgi:predicted ATPase